MTTIALIQARLGSVRFPEKCLADLMGRPLITHVIERVCAVRNLANVVLVVPATDAEYFATVTDGPIYCDPMVDEADVLGRFRSAAIRYPADHYLRVTGDCPLFAPDVAELVMRRHHEETADYTWNDTLTTGWPDGTDVEMFTVALLARTHLDRELTRADCEHVTPAMRRQSGVRVVTVPAPMRWDQKWSVDDSRDFQVVKEIFNHLKHGELNFASTLAASGVAQRS